MTYMAAGRKTKYKDSYKNELIQQMKDGNSYTSFAAKIGVHIDTLYEWEKKYPEFSEAKKIAFAQSQAFWEDIGLKMAMDGNSQVWKFNMKNRFGWIDTPPPNTYGNKEIRLVHSERQTELINIDIDLDDLNL